MLDVYYAKDIELDNSSTIIRSFIVKDQAKLFHQSPVEEAHLENPVKHLRWASFFKNVLPQIFGRVLHTPLKNNPYYLLPPKRAARLLSAYVSVWTESHKISKIWALRARFHDTRIEPKPLWNLKPLWNVVPFTLHYMEISLRQLSKQ